MAVSPRLKELLDLSWVKQAAKTHSPMAPPAIVKEKSVMPAGVGSYLRICENLMEEELTSLPPKIRSYQEGLIGSFP